MGTFEVHYFSTQDPFCNYLAKSMIGKVEEMTIYLFCNETKSSKDLKTCQELTHRTLA